MASLGGSTGAFGQWLEADEDIRQPGVVEQLAELAGDLGRGRQDGIERPDGGRCLRGLAEAGHRSQCQQTAGEPDDEQRLGRTGQAAGDAIGGAEIPRPEGLGAGPPDGRADRLTDADSHQ